MFEKLSVSFFILLLMMGQSWASLDFDIDDDESADIERDCRGYKSQIRRLSDRLMNLPLGSPFTMGDGSTNLNTLGELQKQHAKYMAELVLLNGMREINQRSVAMFARSESIDAFQNFSTAQRIDQLPAGQTILAAMSDHEQRAAQIATHQIVSGALTDLTGLDMSFVRSTENSPEALGALIQRVCSNTNNRGTICEVENSGNESHKRLLRGMLEHYVIAVQNSSDENPSISPEELSRELNLNLGEEFLTQYNNHYRSFSELAHLLPEIQNCSDEQCTTTRKNDFLNAYTAFTEAESNIVGHQAPQILPTEKINNHLKRYTALAELASRNAENDAHRGFETTREMRTILQRALSSAFPRDCAEEQDGCLERFNIASDGTISMNGELNFTLDSSNLEARINRLKTEVSHINNAINNTKQSSDFKHLNGVISYLSAPLNYRRFCGRNNTPLVRATCGYDGNNALNRVGSLISDGNEILAHTYNNTPLINLEQLESFCERQREIYRERSESAFRRDWGATCSLADRNVQLRDSALPNQTITEGQLFDPVTNQRYDIEYPTAGENYLNGFLAGFIPNVGGLVGTYYQNRYMDLYLANNPSYWIYPPASYYSGSNLFSTAWSPVGGINGLNGYMF
jgi:hypothetical protein